MSKLFTIGSESSDNHQVVITPGQPVTEQIHRQLPGLNPGKDDVVILHPKPEVGAAAVAYVHGFTATRFPKISLRVGDEEFGELDLFEYRHNAARPMRTRLLETPDRLAEDLVIVINPTGRQIESYQFDDMLGLLGRESRNRTVVNFSMGQAGRDYSWEEAPTEVLKRLEAALAENQIGRSIANRRVVCLTLGLSPLNAMLVTALNALCESWPEQLVAEKIDGKFRFTELVNLQAAEGLGRANAAESAKIGAPLFLPRGRFDFWLEAVREAGLTSVQQDMEAFIEGR